MFNKFLSLVIGILLATQVHAQDNGVIASPLSTIVRSDSGIISLENGQLKAIQMVFGSETATPVTFSFTSTGFSLPALTLSGNLTFTSATASILQGTSDAADNGYIALSGGGATGLSRGSFIQVTGNEAIGGIGGALVMRGGGASTGHVYIGVNNASAQVKFQNGSSADMWTFNNSGALTQDATNGGSLIMTKAPTSSESNILLGSSAISAVGASNLATVSSPATTLQASFVSNQNDAGGTSIGLYKTRATTTAATTIVNSGDTIASLGFYGADGTTYRQAAAIKAIVDTTPGASDMPGGLVLQTTPDGSTTPANVLYLDNAKAALFSGTVRSSATSDIGWSVVNAVNQACNTTCTSACVVGIDTLGTGGFLSCATATADSCLCAGAS